YEGIRQRFDNSNTSNLRDFKTNHKQEDMVWHFHGYIDHPEHIILTPESYKTLYASDTDEKYVSAINTLKDIISTETILFIGSSLSDIELLEEINHQNKLFSNNTGPHYALIKESNVPLIKEKLAGISSSIQIIPFDDFGEPLESLLQAIANGSSNNYQTSGNKQVQSILIKSPVDTISVLFANPLDHEINYEPYVKSLKKFKSELLLKPLNNDSIWDESDYVFILSRWTKTGL
ncbi:SIR2 family NAD-dependent protein deacylase, partial [Vibrio splendidus]|uniref:SIR2 family NAD-dependent protein deacylase n=1 Tax=Vibrio splendidus TaxID=29497 RepID=UPI000D4E8ECB